MKKLIIINILLLALVIPTIALARVVDYEEVTLDATETGDRSNTVYGFYKIFNGHNSSSSRDDVWFVARYYQNGTYYDDLATDKRVGPGQVVNDTTTVSTPAETYWYLWLTPWNLNYGCNAYGTIRLK